MYIFLALNHFVWYKDFQNAVTFFHYKQENQCLDFFSFPFSFLQLSSKLIEESRNDERDSLLNQLDKQHQQQRLALTAELDAEDAEHKRQLTQAMDEDHTGTLRNIHHDLNTQVDCYYLVALFF